MNRTLLEDFIKYYRECGEDVFYIFENTEEAIDNFLNQFYYYKDE